MTLSAIIISLIAVVITILLMLTRQRLAPALAWFSLAILWIADANVPRLSTIIFWAVATAIATTINFMLPDAVVDSRRGQGFISGGALCGMFIGMIINNATLIVGAIIGAFIGSLVFSHTPSGRSILSPTSKFVNYVCAKAMPTIISACTIGVSISYILKLNSSL